MLGLLSSRTKLQTITISSWALFGVTYYSLVAPYNSFQKNVNMILTSVVKLTIFMISTINGLIGRQSKDAAGAFSDFCGPVMIFCVFAMVGANILLQLAPMWKPLGFIASMFGDLIARIFIGAPSMSGVESIATPRALPKKKAKEMLDVVVKQLSNEIEHHLSSVLDYSIGVYYYQFKRCVKEWAEERHKAFIETGEAIGDMPMESWHERSIAGFKRALYQGYQNKEEGPIDLTNTSPEKVAEAVLLDWITYNVEACLFRQFLFLLLRAFSSQGPLPRTIENGHTRMNACIPSNIHTYIHT